MALTQLTKDRAAQLQDQGAWLKLFILIAQFGLELIQYLRERKKEKQDGNKQSMS
jgi:hypothetical protein